MEGGAQKLLTKGINQDDAVICKDSPIPNGLNGGYELGNGDAHSDAKKQKSLKKNCSDSEEIMEVDTENNVEPRSSEKPSADRDVKCSDGGEVANNAKSNNKNNTKCNDAKDSSGAMDVDDANDASDIECLGDDDDDDDVVVAPANANNDCSTSEGDIIEEDVVVNKPSAARKGADGAAAAAADTSDAKICEENGSIGSDVQEITDDGGKSNGHDSATTTTTTTDSLNDSPAKKKNKKAIDFSSITPRRSSRNINRKSYTEREDEEGAMIIDNNSDIEEIKPEDPLAVDYSNKEKHKSSIKNITTTNNKTTIVVNDTKRLVEIAAGSKNMKGGKKEPTLVIIDTNSILSGKGGVPVSKSHHQSHHHNMSGSSSFSMMPIGIGPQQMYGNTRTTITPVPMKSHLNSNKSTTITPVINPMHHSQQQHHHQQQQLHHHHQQQQQQQQQQQILPTLTDDMYVVEAPSFIVPYVYEKPPIKPLKEFTNQLGKSIEEYNKEEKQKRKERREKAIAEGTKVDEDDEETDEEDDKPAKAEKPAEPEAEKSNKVQTYFDLPLGKFFMSIGIGLVQEFVQTDLLRTQKRKASKGQTSAETQMAINSLIKNLEFSKENNEPYRLEMKKCEFCNFKTESALVMQHHLETPHMKNYVYKCNYCPSEVRSPHDILYHMEAEHNVRGRLERGPAFHQCPNCPFEDNQKGKLSRHIIACQKKFRPERNLEPSIDWEPPAKIPRMNRPRNLAPQPTSAQLAMAMNVVKGQAPLLPKLLPAPPTTGRGRGRPPMQPRYPDLKAMGSRSGSSPVGMRQDNMSSMMYRPTSSGLLVPTSYQFSGNNQIFQNTSVTNAAKNPTAKLLSQPSISITPLPRTAPQPSGPGLSGSQSKPGGKSTFVICEICDGYIKDLEQLRNHMQWIHKVKIHPKMIYNRPPLNCQKCQFRFFTDQGLERHLLGSHGLVTSSMQEAANKGKDAGRCPACGRVFQWKLLNHVARDHGMTLKPAHLSYKCTVCTATFGMYKQFENHVYSAHSVVAKRVMDNKKSSAPSSPSSRSNDSLLKPLKINDEITIIPQPAKPTARSSGSQGRGK